MKKTLIIVLSLCIFSSMLCACSYSGQNENDDILLSDSTLSSDDYGKILVELESPPEHYSYTYDTYQDLARALSQKGSSEYSMLREEQESCGTVYKKTLSEFSSGNFKIAVPQINESPISLRNKKGFSNVSLLTNELYNMPWVWYHCVINDQSIDVKIAYLNAVVKFKDDSTVAYTDILQLIAPSAPCPDNYEKYESYAAIYEKELNLKGGVNVKAMISEMKDKTKVYVKFYYDGMLISLYGEKDLFTYDFWKSFSIGMIQ